MDHIPYIVFINLDKRTDRREQIETELNGLSFERFSAIFNSSGIVGCTQSHLEVLKLSKQRGYKSVLILEDDFTFLVSRKEFEDEIELISDVDYDVCMLAYNLIESTDIKECSFLRKVLNAQTASAYIVKEHYYDVLIQLYELNIPLLKNTGEHWNYANDQCWKILQTKDNWICTNTRIGKQRDGYSDNANKYVSYNC
jgi:GR25 family glycosyltransferase involved in LPS biosynthesis